MTIAGALRPVVSGLIGDDPPVAIRAWDGSLLGPRDGPATIVIRSPRAIRRLLYAPDELGFGRSYVAGELDIEGDVYAALAVRDALAGRRGHADLRLGWRRAPALLRAARAVGALGPPLPPPPHEAHLRGRRHSKARD